MNDLIVMLVVILMINILIILCMQMIFASLHPLKHILQIWYSRQTMERVLKQSGK